MKKAVWIGMIVGSIAGGYIPALFGASVFSITSLIGSIVGGVAGIYLGYKVGKLLNG